MLKTKEEYLWANGLNAFGLLSKEPILVKYDPELDSYWDESGNFEVNDVGKDKRENYITVASPDYDDVYYWTHGVRAAHEVLGDTLCLNT